MYAVEVIGYPGGCLIGPRCPVIEQYQPAVPHYPGVSGVKGEHAVGVEVSAPGRAAVGGAEERSVVAGRPGVGRTCGEHRVQVGGRPAGLRRPGGSAVGRMDNGTIVPHRPAVVGIKEVRVVQVCRNPGGAAVTGLENDGAHVANGRDVYPHRHRVQGCENHHVLEDLLGGTRPHNGPVGTAVNGLADYSHLPYRVAVVGVEKVNALHLRQHQRW